MIIDIGEFNKLQKDVKRIGVLNLDTIFDRVLEKFLWFLCFTRPKDKIVEQLFNPPNGFLVSLTNKAKLAYALGFIDKTVQSDLEQIHRIRNEFAHSAEADFANEEVIKYVRKLSTAKGKRVTKKESYKLYKKATNMCAENLSKVIEQKLSE